MCVCDSACVASWHYLISPGSSEGMIRAKKLGLWKCTVAFKKLHQRVGDKARINACLMSFLVVIMKPKNISFIFPPY